MARVITWRLLWVVAAVSIAVAMIIQSTQPPLRVGNAKADFYLTSGAHFIIWATLVFATMLGVGRFTSKTVVAVALGGVIFGLTDELHQAFVISRTASALDFVLDTLGATAGALSAAWLNKRRTAWSSDDDQRYPPPVARP